MAFCKVINALLLAVIISLCSAQDTRLINSHWASSTQFPYHAAIVSRSPQSGRLFVCSGAVVASNWILTSAACVLQSSQYEVRVNSVNFYTGGTVVISRVGHAHPEYDPFTQLNNFGLIQASVPVSTSERLLLLPSTLNLVLTQRQSVITGWGLTPNNEISPVLQFDRGTILNSEDRNCRFNFNNVTINTPRMCAAFSGQQRCSGDTGSPLVIQANRTNYLVGVASFTPLNGRCERSISLFGSLTPAVRNWITEITGLRP